MHQTNLTSFYNESHVYIICQLGEGKEEGDANEQASKHFLSGTLQFALHKYAKKNIK